MNEEETSVDNTKDTNNDTAKGTIKKTTKSIKRIRRIIVFIVMSIFVLHTAISIRAEYLSYIGIGEEYASVFNERVKSIK